MATIAEQLTELQAVKSGLKTALTADGADMSAVPFTEYPGKVQTMSDRWRSLLDGSVTEVNIKGVKRLREYIFCASVFLENVNFLDNILNEISAQAFLNCYGLKSVTIPDSVTTIGQSAFRGCSVLARLVVGSSVNNIGATAFAIGSSHISPTIIMKPTTPPQIASNTIGQYVSRIVVPYESRINYALETNWAAHQSKLEVRLAVSISEGAVNLDQDILDGDVSTYLYRAEAVENTEETGSKTIYCYTNNATVGQEYGSNISNVSSLVFEANPDAEGVSA